MGGQDGYSRTMARYSEESNTLLGGFKVRPNNWTVGVYLGYTQAEGGMAQYELPADDYVATHPTMSFDFTNSYSYSNLDVSRLEGDLNLKYTFADGLWLRFWYRLIDYQDDQPYLYDTSGTVQWATFTAGWKF